MVIISFVSPVKKVKMALELWHSTVDIVSFFHHTVAQIAQSFCFTSIKHLHEISTGSPPAGALNRGGV